MLEFTISALVIPSIYWSILAVDLADGADIMGLFINQDIHGVLLIVFESYIKLNKFKTTLNMGSYRLVYSMPFRLELHSSACIS